MGLCPEEEVDRDARWLKMPSGSQCSPVRTEKTCSVPRRSHRPAPGSRVRGLPGLTATQTAMPGAGPPLGARGWIPTVWLGPERCQDKPGVSALVEPQIGAQIRPPSGGIHALKLLSAAINGVG